MVHLPGLGLLARLGRAQPSTCPWCYATISCPMAIRVCPAGRSCPSGRTSVHVPLVFQDGSRRIGFCRLDPALCIRHRPAQRPVDCLRLPLVQRELVPATAAMVSVPRLQRTMLLSVVAYPITHLPPPMVYPTR